MAKAKLTLWADSSWKTDTLHREIDVVTCDECVSSAVSDATQVSSILQLQSEWDDGLLLAWRACLPRASFRSRGRT